MADGWWLVTNDRRARRDLSQGFSVRSAISALIVVFGRERRHRERPGSVRVHRRRRADAVLPHQGAQTREQHRKLLGRRMRACKQGVLHDTARRWVDEDRHAIDRGRRRVRFEIEQQERAERPHVTNRRRQLQMAIVPIRACPERSRSSTWLGTTLSMLKG